VFNRLFISVQIIQFYRLCFALKDSGDNNAIPLTLKEY